MRFWIILFGLVISAAILAMWIWRDLPVIKRYSNLFHRSGKYIFWRNILIIQAKFLPISDSFKFVNIKKSYGTKSSEYGEQDSSS